MPQLARMTIHKGALLCLRWPYQANVMKMFEVQRSTMGSHLDSRSAFISEVGVSDNSDGNAAVFEVIFDLADGKFAEVEDAGCENGIGFAGEEDFSHVLQLACATAGDDGHVDRFADAAGDLEIE